MKRNNLPFFVVCWFALALSPIDAQDRSEAGPRASGTVAGVVIDESTGEYLENVRIEVEGSGLTAASARDGTYRVSLPPGDHVIVAKYSGLPSLTRSVTVREGERAVVDFSFVSGTVLMDAYEVSFRRGAAEEVMLRRQATNVVDVMSSKTFGEMADGSLNISRLAGMTGGTGVRGIAGESNLVRVDGGALATPSDATASGTSRSVDINQIPGDMIERIEVTKTPRPDMDADAVGGTINLITKSALDRAGRRTTYSIGGISSPSYEVQKMGYLASFEHSDIIGDSRRLGYSLTLNHNRRYSNVERITTDYFTDLVPGVPLGGPAPVSSFRATQELKYEDRTGVGLKFDFKPLDTLIMQFGALYQHRFSHGDSADWRLTNRNHLLKYDTDGGFWYAPDRVRAGRDNTDGAVPLRDAGGNIIAYPSGRGEGGVLDTFTENVTDFLTARQYRHANRAQEQYRDTYSFVYSGRYTGWDDTRIEANLSYSWGQAKRREWPDGLGTFQYDITGSHVRIDRTNDFLHPEVTFTGGTSPTNVDAVGVVNLLQLLDATQTEEQVGLTLNYERRLRTRIPIALKTGLRYRGVDLDIDRGEHQYRFLGSINDLIGDTINPFGLYPSSMVPNIRRVRDNLTANPELWDEDEMLYIQKQHEHNGNASERIQGTFLMAEMQLGSLTLLPGVRHEWTQTKATATVRNEGLEDTPEEWTGKATGKGRYSNTFPHLHMKYEFRDDLIFRAAVSSGIGRPQWKNLMPEGTINPDDMEIEANNPDLGPQYTYNFDFGAEYYFKSGGLFGINLFRKEIDDLIFHETRIIGPEDGYGPEYDGWELRTYSNAAWAWVQGVEFDYRQKLSFLPGWMSRLDVFANLTLLETEGNYSTPDGSTTSDIPGFVPRMTNAGVAYSGERLSARILAQFQAGHLTDWDERSTEYWLFEEDSTSVDVLFSYSINKRFRLFLNITNLFENSPLVYQARPNQPQEVSVTSRRFDFGIRGSL